MKPIVKIILAVAIVLVVAAGSGMIYISRGLETGKNLEINKIDLSALEDGTYEGSYKGGRWSNEVEVSLKEGKIADIEIIKDVVFPQPEITKQLIKRVIERQSTDVDVISGATVTCKAYLKAIENAVVA